MIKVACPSCTAPYELDERRLPQSGLKMRCPKCGASFRVHPSGETGPADAPASSSAPMPAGGSSRAKQTMVGVAPPAAGNVVPPASRADDPDLPARKVVPKPPGAFAPKPPGAFAPKPPPPGAFAPKPPPGAFAPKPPPGAFAPKPPPPRTAGAFGADDADLPAPKRPAPPGQRAPIAPPFGEPPEVDLPVAKPQPKGFPGQPAARRKADSLAATPPGGQARRAAPAPDDGVDLPAPKHGGSAAAFGEVDLPAPKQPAPKRSPLAPAFPSPVPAARPASPSRPLRPTEPEESFADLEIDLPVRKPGGLDVDLPVHKPSAARSAFGGEPDAELPMRKPQPHHAATSRAEPPDSLEADLSGLDLPVPKGHTDLPARKGAPQPGGFDDLDLPVPKGAGFDDLDLPAPKGGGFADLDLPMPKGGADLPAPKRGGRDFGDLDLPIPKSSADLPVAKRGGDFGELDLPVPKGGADLPVAKTGGFDGLDLPVSKGGSDLPVAKDGDFGELDLPISKGDSDLPVHRPGGRAAPAGIGSEVDDLELPEPSAGELDLPPARGESRSADGRGGIGGTGFGEIDFGDEGDDMEFGDLPEERPSMPGVREAAQARGAIGVADEVSREGKRGARVERVERPVERPRARRRGRGLAFVFVLLVILVLAGVGAGMFTPYGYFGVYALEQLLPEAGDEAGARRVIDAAEQTATSDTYADVSASISALGAARRKTGLNRRLLARSLLHESLYQVRFGEHTASESRSVAILERLESRGGEAPGMALARAARALAEGNAQQARGLLGAARAESPQDPYVDLVAGEAALAANDAPQAAEAFASAVENGGGARAHWGAARAAMHQSELEDALPLIEATLEASPRHAEALVAKARVLFARDEVDEAVALARQAAGVDARDGETLRPSPGARADAWTLLGRIHERRGSRTLAREAYDRALEADPFRVAALIGAGRVLLADGRHRDALARFEAVLESGETELSDQSLTRPLQAEAKLGAARAMIHLDRVQDAKATLQELAAERTEDPDVVLWLGKAEQALGDTGAAEQHYRETVRLSPARFDGYLALAQLFFESSRPGDAVAVLTEAQRQVDDTAQVRRMLGESELARNNVDAAIREFRRALELDPTETAALFGLGVAQRRGGKLTDAQATFARVAEQDASWPGLPLERGMVFEALGEADRAVEMFGRALAEDPEDPDLMLRLGAAQVAAGQIDEAEETLRRVMEAQRNSAEAEHFMGRVLLARGDADEAMHHFSRAVSLDPNRGEFWLYVAWAAVEEGELGRALESVQKAIELDPSLGDAYWIRGRIRVRTGAVQDARGDLERALELKPSRHEAYAALGDAYDQLRRVSDAVRAYERAVEHNGTRGDWWYRLGRLRMDAGNPSGARAALGRATTIGDAIAPQPGWLPDAHRVLADAARLGGARQEAIQHYRRYLEIAPAGAIDREDVERNLAEIERGR